MAEALLAGGVKLLKQKGWHEVGREKSKWAEKITPFVNVDRNKSPSFQYFRDKLRDLTRNDD